MESATMIEKRAVPGERASVRPVIVLYFAFFTLCFGTLTFCAFDSYLHNAEDFSFALNDFAGYVLAINLLLPAIPALILAPLCRKHPTLFRYTAFVTLGLIVACWVQINFLNLSLSLLDGTNLSSNGWALNAVVWIAMIAASILAARICRNSNAWKRPIILLMAALIVMQSVGLVYQYFVVRKWTVRDENSYYFSNEEQFTLSENENIVVLLFDSLSNNTFESASKEYPEIRDWFSDFEYFDNMDSTYLPTYPSLLHLATGRELDMSKSTDENFSMAWENADTISAYEHLKAAGYSARIFHNASVELGGAGRTAGMIDNVASGGYEVHLRWLLAKLYKLAIFRSAPLALKPLFVSDIESFGTVVAQIGPGRAWRDSNYAMYPALCEQGLTVQSGEEKIYAFHYLFGIHNPLTTNRDCMFVEDEVSFEECTRGCMLLVHTYLELLKENGLYDNTTFIVMADHGNFKTGLQPAFLIKRAHERRDAMEINSAPVSYREFFPTVLMLAGVKNYADYGQTIYDIKAGDERERAIYMRNTDENYPPVPKYHGTGMGRRNVFDCYTYTGDREQLWQKFIKNSPDRIIPMVDTLD